MKPGRPVHPTNGTGAAPDGAGTPGGVEVTFDGGPNRLRQSTGYVIVTNRETAGGNLLEISFANGSQWFAIAPETTISFNVMCHRCYLRGDGGAADYSVMGIVI